MKKEIVKIKNKKRQVTNNREEMQQIVEVFYTDLYQTKHLTNQSKEQRKRKVINVNSAN